MLFFLFLNKKTPTKILSFLFEKLYYFEGEKNYNGLCRNYFNCKFILLKNEEERDDEPFFQRYRRFCEKKLILVGHNEKIIF